MRTYLNGSVKNGNIMRWTINPLIVYIAPMKFYSESLGRKVIVVYCENTEQVIGLVDVSEEDF